jgi:hypothetical protein
MVKALRRWLEANELFAIITAVLGVIVLLSLLIVVGGYLFVTRSTSDVLGQHSSRPRVRLRLDVRRPQVLVADIL